MVYPGKQVKQCEELQLSQLGKLSTQGTQATVEGGKLLMSRWKPRSQVRQVVLLEQVLQLLMAVLHS